MSSASSFSAGSSDRSVLPAGIPTNIVTGFLGVGKSSAIMHLLKRRPPGERWAVLVNEFGAVGVDGSLIEGQNPVGDPVMIREVAGGCMCCVAGPQLGVALNQLIRRARPDRLLIEPSGLGHPLEVVRLLRSEHYRKLISLEKIATLVDARKLVDPRYTQHPIFNQQIGIADVLVGNKQDLYGADDCANLVSYAAAHGSRDANVIFTCNGAVALEQLRGTTGSDQPGDASDVLAGPDTLLDVTEPALPDGDYLSRFNRGEGFESAGWRFHPSWVFSREKILAFLKSLGVERAKAIFITSDGVFAYNLTRDALQEVELDDCVESRLEIISDRLDVDLEARLLACATSSHRPSVEISAPEGLAT